MPRWGDISPGRIQVTPPAPLVRAGDGTDRPGLRGGGGGRGGDEEDGGFPVAVGCAREPGSSGYMST